MENLVLTKLWLLGDTSAMALFIFVRLAHGKKALTTVVLLVDSTGRVLNVIFGGSFEERIDWSGALGRLRQLLEAGPGLVRIGVARGTERHVITIDTHRPRTSIRVIAFTDVIEVREFLSAIKELIKVA